MAFVLVGAIWPDETAEKTNEILGWITRNFGWLFVLTSAGFVLPLGKYWRSSPLVFSLEPRCHGE